MIVSERQAIQACLTLWGKIIKRGVKEDENLYDVKRELLTELGLSDCDNYCPLCQWYAAQEHGGCPACPISMCMSEGYREATVRPESIALREFFNFTVYRCEKRLKELKA